LTLIRIGERVTGHGDPVTAGSIAHELGVPEDRVTPIVARLEEEGLVADAVAKEGIKESRELLLTRSLDKILVSEALEFGRKDDHHLEPNVGRMIYRIEEI